MQDIGEIIKSMKGRILADLILIGQIPAPTFKEERRADFVADKMALLGLEVWKDTTGNVIGLREGMKQKPSILVSAHLDTVFSREIPHNIRISQDKAIGPGVGDNTLGLVTLLILNEILDTLDIKTHGDIYFVSTVASEAFGNLKGMRALLTQIKDKIDYCLCLEGHRLGRIDHWSVGTLRVNVSCKTLGGHSWTDSGMPNAIDIIIDVIQNLRKIELPTHPKSVINFGFIQGGTSYDSIAQEVKLGIEFKSDDMEIVDNMEKELHQIIGTINKKEDIQLGVERVARRPAFGIYPDHNLVKVTTDVHRQLNIKSQLGAATSDASIPLSYNIPALTLGITTGSGNHTIDEYIDIPPIFLGIEQVIRIILKLNNIGR